MNNQTIAVNSLTLLSIGDSLLVNHKGVYHINYSIQQFS